MAVLKKIGDIQLFAEIKRGDTDRSGSTYRGLDMTSQQYVLVKTFKTGHDLGGGNGAPSRFQQEAAIYATIQHPNVVKILRYGAEDGVRFLVLEFVEGLTLRALLQRASSNALPWEIAVAIFLGVLEGVREIHQHGVIHRDLKPENILIGNDGSVKICDFDLAISEQKPIAPTEISKSGLTGSPGYIAPEIVLGETPTSVSDIFSLGIVLYEMLSGARPFETPSATGEMNSIVKLPHVSLLTMNPMLPAGFDELVDQLLTKDPAKRASTIGEVLSWFRGHFNIATDEARREMVRRYLVDPQTTLLEISLRQMHKKSTDRTFQHRRRTIAALLSVSVAVAGFVTWSNLQNDGIGDEQRGNQNVLMPNRQDVAQTNTLQSSNEPAQKSAAAISSTIKQQLDSKKDNANAIDATSSSEAKTYAVLIDSNPWAFLFIDGDSIGQTPLSGAVALNAGSHDLLFKNPKLPPIRVAEHIDETVADTLTYSLWDHVAQLEIQITPWAEMFIGGERRELPPGEKTLILSPGKYSFRFVHPQLGEKRETLFLQAGETRKLTMNMF